MYICAANIFIEMTRSQIDELNSFLFIASNQINMENLIHCQFVMHHIWSRLHVCVRAPSCLHVETSLHLNNVDWKRFHLVSIEQKANDNHIFDVCDRRCCRCRRCHRWMLVQNEMGEKLTCKQDDLYITDNHNMSSRSLFHTVWAVYFSVAVAVVLLDGFLFSWFLIRAYLCYYLRLVLLLVLFPLMLLACLLVCWFVEFI